jgi:hypothetical protein
VRSVLCRSHAARRAQSPLKRDAEQRRWLKLEKLTDFGVTVIARGERSGTCLASSYDGHVYEVQATACARHAPQQETSDAGPA